MTPYKAGLKILFAAMQVWVQLPSRVLIQSRLWRDFFMYHIYILYSKKFDRYYTGQCKDLDARLKRHNNGAVPSTKSFIPWELVYTEVFDTRTQAVVREKEIKDKKSRKYIEKLISIK